MSQKKIKDMSENIEEPTTNVIASEGDSSTERGDLPNKIASPHSSSVGPQAPRNDGVVPLKSPRSPRSPKKTKKQRSKKYLEVQEKVEKTHAFSKSKEYPLDDALELLKELSYTKFEGTVELHINTSQKNLRGLLTLPFAAGKALRVAAMGKNAAESGADIIIDEKAMPDLEKGRINFDALVVTPDQMPKIARLARILGPRGLMPNPKNGTISDDLKKAVGELQGGKTEYEQSSTSPSRKNAPVQYKTQKDSQVIHLSVGKVNQEKAQVAANIKTLYQTLGKSRVKRVILAPTMGPSVRVSLSSL